MDFLRRILLHVVSTQSPSKCVKRGELCSHKRSRFVFASFFKFIRHIYVGGKEIKPY
jgi:hypothetical protein